MQLKIVIVTRCLLNLNQILTFFKRSNLSGTQSYIIDKTLKIHLHIFLNEKRLHIAIITL